MKRFHWFELALIIVVMSVHISVAFSAPHNFSTTWFVRDDAYYYFKVAQNVSEGHGSTFDGINPTNGYHPLWMLVCVPIFALARFDLILPLRVLLVVMAALSVIAAILLFRLLKKPAGEPLAMLCAAYWALDLNIHGIITQQGLETGLLAFAVLVLLRLMQLLDEKEALSAADFVKLALAALFVLFSRLDSIYLVLIAGVWMVFRRTPIRYLVPVDLLLVFGLVVGAFIQRAGLKFYYLVFADSAILMSVIAFVWLAVIFYLLGLYDHPRQASPRQLLARTTIGVTLATLLTSLSMWLLAAFDLANMPRAVPLLFWPAMLILTLATRFGLRWLSLRPATNLPGQTAFSHQVKTRFRALSNWLRAFFTYYGIVLAGLLGYLGLNQILFDTWMPVSGQIKRWWNSLPNNIYSTPVRNILDVYTLDPLNSQSWGLLTQPVRAWAESISTNGETLKAWYWGALLALLAAWLFVILRQRRGSLPRLFQTGLLPLLAAAWLHGFLYKAMGYAASHEWYWVTQMLALVLLAALGLRGLLEMLPRGQIRQWLAWGGSGALSLLVASSFAVNLFQRMPFEAQRTGQPYVDMLPILENYTEPGAIIGMTGGGQAGYFIQERTIINMDGLINSAAYFEALKAGQGDEYLAAQGMDYIFANPEILVGSMPYLEQFSPEEFTRVAGAPVYSNKELLRFTPQP